MKFHFIASIAICVFSGILLKFFEGETTWTSVALPIQDNLVAIDFATPDDGWGVGNSILHWDGNEWSVFPNPTQMRYLALQLLDSNNGWAVGDGGVIIHWDGEQWEQVSSPTDYPLFDVSFLSPHQGWAVGGNVTVINPRDPSTMNADNIILNWDGANWNIVPTPKDSLFNWELFSIGMVSETDGWAAGNGKILRWNGDEWFEHIPAISGYEYIEFKDIQAVDAQNVWFVGHKRFTGHILHWDGIELKEVFKTNLGLNAIAIVSSEFGWAVGGNSSDDGGGSLLLQWDGVTWKEIESPTSFPLHFVWADSESNGWILATGNTPDTGENGNLFRLTENFPPTETPTAFPPTPANKITETIAPAFSPVFEISPTIITTDTSTPFPPETKNYNVSLTSILIYSVLLVLTFLVTVVVFQKRK